MTLKDFKGLIIGIVIIAVVGVGGWFLYWTLALKGANNQYNVNTHTQQYQAGLVQQLRDKQQGYDLATDPAQKANFKQTFCAMYPDLTQPPNDLIDANIRICINNN